MEQRPQKPILKSKRDDFDDAGSPAAPPEDIPDEAGDPGTLRIDRSGSFEDSDPMNDQDKLTKKLQSLSSASTFAGSSRLSQFSRSVNISNGQIMIRNEAGIVLFFLKGRGRFSRN